MRRAKGINRAKIAQGAMSVRSGMMAALAKATNLTRLRKDRLIGASFLFVAATVTIAWMIWLAWGALTLAERLFS